MPTGIFFFFMHAWKKVRAHSCDYNFLLSAPCRLVSPLALQTKLCVRPDFPFKAPSPQRHISLSTAAAKEGGPPPEVQQIDMGALKEILKDNGLNGTVKDITIFHSVRACALACLRVCVHVNVPGFVLFVEDCCCAL